MFEINKLLTLFSEYLPEKNKRIKIFTKKGDNMFIGIVAGIIVLIWLITNTIKIVPEYERGVVFRLGRLMGARGPGLFLLIPGVEKMVKMSLRTVTFEVTPSF